MFASIARSPGRRWSAWRRYRVAVPRWVGALGLAGLGAVQLAWSVRQLATTRRLRRASSRAADDASTKTTFLRLATHEIRAPLALARGYVDIVRGGTLGPVNREMAEALTSVEERLGQIEELVVQMVETARLDSGGPGLRLAPLDMRKVVAEAVERVSDQAGARHPLRVSVPDRSEMVLGERFRLRTLLVNLLSNAIKYSPEGGEVRCTLRRRGRSVEVAVADRGIGIDPAEVRRLFEPFTRLSEGARVAPNGMGLGLHLARTIAEAHRGTLSAAENPGGGSVFTLTLPRSR